MDALLKLIAALMALLMDEEPSFVRETYISLIKVIEDRLQRIWVDLNMKIDQLTEDCANLDAQVRDQAKNLKAHKGDIAWWRSECDKVSNQVVDLQGQVDHWKAEEEFQRSENEFWHEKATNREIANMNLENELKEERKFSNKLNSQLADAGVSLHNFERVQTLAQVAFHNWVAERTEDGLQLENREQYYLLQDMVSTAYEAGWNKIETIKAVRTILKSGLRDAKDLVEQYGHDWNIDASARDIRSHTW